MCVCVYVYLDMYIHMSICLSIFEHNPTSSLLSQVKVVLAAAMWNTPHIVILDEPTNYLDRDSLGASAKTK